MRLLQFLAKYESLERGAPLALSNGPEVTYAGLLKPLAETGDNNDNSRQIKMSLRDFRT